MDTSKVKSRMPTRSRYAKLTPWILVCATFLCHLLTSGVSYSIGVYYTAILEAFGKSYGVTSWIGSLNQGMLGASGPLASFSIDKLGGRVTVLIGGLMSALGILIGSFSRSIALLFISFGILTGLGYGLVFTSCYVVIGEKLTQHRALSMGISISGIGLGNFLYPVLANYLMDVYGWRGSLLITSGFTLHVCLFGFLIPGKSAAKIKSQNGQTNTGSCELGNNTQTDIVTVTSSEHKSSTMNGSNHLNNSALVLKANSQSCQQILDEQRKHLDKDNSTSCHEKTDEVMKHTPNAFSQARSEISAKSHVVLMPAYWLIHSNALLFCLSQSVILTHISAFSQNLGVHQNKSNILISVIGASGIVGKILLGAVAQQKSINSYLLYITCLVCAGLAMFGVTFWTTFPGLLILMILYGIFSSAYGPVLTEIILKTFGTDKFNYVLGFMMLSCAVGSTLGAPLAGWMYDCTQLYTSSFYFGGLCLIVSAAVVLPLMVNVCCKT